MHTSIKRLLLPNNPHRILHIRQRPVRILMRIRRMRKPRLGTKHPRAHLGLDPITPNHTIRARTRAIVELQNPPPVPLLAQILQPFAENRVLVRQQLD